MYWGHSPEHPWRDRRELKSRNFFTNRKSIEREQGQLHPHSELGRRRGFALSTVQISSLAEKQKEFSQQTQELMGRSSWSLCCFTPQGWNKTLCTHQPSCSERPIQNSASSPAFKSGPVEHLRGTAREISAFCLCNSLELPPKLGAHRVAPLQAGTRISQTSTRGLGNFNIFFPLQVISSVYALWSSLGVSEQNKCHF